MNQTFKVESEAEYAALLPEVVKAIEAYKVVLFQGEMGAGKTTFIRHLIRHLGTQDEVSSPTYAIVNTYDTNKGIIHHFDCYRFESAEEAYDIGMEEYLYGSEICLIEWPDRVAELLPDRVLIISISALQDGSRTLKIVGT